MIKVTKLFVRDLNRILIERLIDYSRSGYADRNYTVKIGQYIVRFEIEHAKDLSDSTLKIVSDELDD